MKDFSVSSDNVRIAVKVVRDELHDCNRYLMIVSRPNSTEIEYRLVQPFGLFDEIEAYL